MSMEIKKTAGALEEWMPLLEYAVQTGMSVSTVRRYIKANKIAYKLENGKYFIHNPGGKAKGPILDQTELVQAQNQINELKMLIAIYEEKLSKYDH